MTVDRSALREAVLSKGLLDDDFYLANYGERIPPAEPPIDHYVRLGHDLGHIPCAAFDPVLHGVLHAPTSPSEWPDRADAEASARRAAEFFPGLDVRVHYGVDVPSAGDAGPAGKPDYRANVQEILDNPTRPVKFPTPVGTYKFRNPPSLDLFGAIESGRPFSFVRIPHGFWDCVSAVDRVADDLAVDARTAALPEEHRRALAIRLIGSEVPRNGNFSGDYIETILDDLSHHPRSSNMLTGISFKGFPTFEDSAFGFWPVTPSQLVRAERFTKLFSPYDRLYDATVWKRWAILGELKDFPGVLRRRPVIMVARESFAILGERLDLPRLVMVPIPEIRTQLIRRQVLKQIEAAIEGELGRDPGQTPVVLFQSGATVSYWFIRRLRITYPKVIYLDIGQALNMWCLDLVGRDGMWVKVYYDQFSRANGTGRAGLVAPPQG